MMESPLSWNLIKRTIAEAIQEFHRQQEDGRFGLSQVSIIYNALLDAGYLSTEDAKVPSEETFSTWHERVYSVGRRERFLEFAHKLGEVPVSMMAASEYPNTPSCDMCNDPSEDIDYTSTPESNEFATPRCKYHRIARQK